MLKIRGEKCCILYRTFILQLVFLSYSVSQLENKERVSCRSRAPARARRVMGMLPGSFSLHVDARRLHDAARISLVGWHEPVGDRGRDQAL